MSKVQDSAERRFGQIIKSASKIQTQISSEAKSARNEALKVVGLVSFIIIIIGGIGLNVLIKSLIEREKKGKIVSDLENESKVHIDEIRRKRSEAEFLVSLINREKEKYRKDLESLENFGKKMDALTSRVDVQVKFLSDKILLSGLDDLFWTRIQVASA